MGRFRSRLRESFAEFFQLESLGGIALIVAMIAALAIANSPIGPEFGSFWSQKLGGSIGSVNLKLSLLHWINDGLMAVFFFVVGLEIKRELLIGELSSRQKATLPIVAALGGMIVPALIYVSITKGTPAVSGWGVPMATDIAFSLGILALLGARIPKALKIFLAALAIVDDIGAVLVIAVFYTSNIDWTALSVGFGVLFILALLNRVRVKSLIPYIVGAVAVWLCFLQSGVHATVAGVLVALTIPSTSKSENERSPLEILEGALHPIQTYAIVPMFALANAGVAFAGFKVGALISGAPLGIVLGLVVGKPIGIVAFSWMAIRMKLAAIPRGVSWAQIAGIGILAGIGFTMSLFIADLAFKDARELDQAKIGILAASFAAGLIGFLLLRNVQKPHAEN